MDQGIRLLLNLTSFQYIYICFQRRHSVLILCRFRVDIFRRGTIVTPSLRRDASVVVNVVLETLSFNCSLFLFSFKSFCCFLSNALLRSRFEWLYSSVLILFTFSGKKEFSVRPLLLPFFLRIMTLLGQCIYACFIYFFKLKLYFKFC